MSLRSFPLYASIVLIHLVLATCCSGQTKANNFWGPIKFSESNYEWFVYPQEILCFSEEKRVLFTNKTLITNENDTIQNCIPQNDKAWFLIQNKIFKVPFVNLEPEEITSIKVRDQIQAMCIIEGGIWAASDKQLHHFDTLNNEWFSFKIPYSKGKLLGCIEHNRVIQIITTHIVNEFDPKTEKWTTYPLSAPFDVPLSSVRVSSFGIVMTDGKTIAIYDKISHFWTKVDAHGEITGTLLIDNHIWFSDQDGLSSISLQSLRRNRVSLPTLDDSKLLYKMYDQLVLLKNGKYIIFSPNANRSFYLIPPQGLFSDTSILFGAKEFHIIKNAKTTWVFNNQIRIWEQFGFVKEHYNNSRTNWNSSKFESKINDSISLQLLGYLKTNSWVNLQNRDSLSKQPLSLIFNTTIHSNLEKNRKIDLFYNNSNPERSALRGFTYHGNDSDIVKSGEAGRVNSRVIQSQLVTSNIVYEGASIDLQSKTVLKNRDRKTSQASIGTGLLTSKRIEKVLPFNRSGNYNLLNDINYLQSPTVAKKILSGSLRVFVDGREIDTLKYSKNLENGELQLGQEVLLDPLSLIQVSYVVEYFSNAPRKLELLPENHFEPITYAVGTISPRDWVSVRSRYVQLGFHPDSIRPVLSTSIPMEIRSRSGDLILKSEPEFTMNSNNGKSAGGLKFQGTLNNSTQIDFEGALADSNFIGIDSLTRGNGNFEKDFSVKLTHDLSRSIPIFYEQKYSDATGGVLNRFGGGLGIHSVKGPWIDLSLTRNVMEKSLSSQLPASLYYTKDKASIDLAGQSVYLSKKITPIENVKYSLSSSLFRTASDSLDTFSFGQALYGSGAVHLVNDIDIAISGIYRKNSETTLPEREIIPSLVISSNDLPQGIDIKAEYKTYYFQNFNPIKAYSQVERGISFRLHPGKWNRKLSWFIPKLGVNQIVNAEYDLYASPSAYLFGRYSPNIQTKLQRMVGFDITPNFPIVIHNTSILTDSVSVQNKYTTNDIDYYQDYKTRWHGHFEADIDPFQEYYYGNFSYDKLFLPWLRCQPGLFASHREIISGKIQEYYPFIIQNDDTISSELSRVGPTFEGEILLHDVKRIERLSSSHFVMVNVLRKDRVIDRNFDVLYRCTMKAYLPYSLSVLLRSSVYMFDMEFDKSNFNLELFGQASF